MPGERWSTRMVRQTMVVEEAEGVVVSSSLSPLVAGTQESEEFRLRSSSQDVVGEQDNFVTSTTTTSQGKSESPRVESEDDGGTSDDEEALHAVIDALEHGEAMIVDGDSEEPDSNASLEGSQQGNFAEAHSVEYWTVGAEGDARDLVKTYFFSDYGSGPMTPSSSDASRDPTETFSQKFFGNGECSSQNEARWYNPMQSQFQQPPPQIPLVASPSAALAHPPMQIFIPPEQSSQPPQFVPVHGAPQIVLPHHPSSIVSQLQAYFNSIPLPITTPLAISYFHGPPIYYQAPPRLPLLDMCSFGEGYGRMEQSELHAEMYEDFMAYSSSTFSVPVSDEELERKEPNNNSNVSKMSEADSTTNEMVKAFGNIPQETSEMVGGDKTKTSNTSSWESQNYFISSTHMHADEQETFIETHDEVSSSGAVSSGYNSLTCSPTSTSGVFVSSPVASYSTDHTNMNASSDSGNGNGSNSSASESDPSELLALTTEGVNDAKEVGYSNGTHYESATYYEQFVQELPPNDPTQGAFVHDLILCTVPYRRDLIYPGSLVILVYGQHDGIGSVIMYNSQELPYVANFFDDHVQSNIKLHPGALCYSYYVPPRTADNDNFGGQLTMWQVKMVQYFLKFHPHVWRMHGIPEIFNLEMFLASSVNAFGEFHIVSKLRFCCRTCKTPWTSKKGTILFKFVYNQTQGQGWILMRIFGQVCVKDDCPDWSFQNPACYPEEIDRAVKKLSEFIGSRCYGLNIPPDSFAECNKSIRKSGGNSSKSNVRSNTTPHKKEFCQACISGVCKNLHLHFPLPHMSDVTAIHTSKHNFRRYKKFKKICKPVKAIKDEIALR